jgi:hypothetical protein
MCCCVLRSHRCSANEMAIVKRRMALSAPAFWCRWETVKSMIYEQTFQFKEHRSPNSAYELWLWFCCCYSKWLLPLGRIHSIQRSSNRRDDKQIREPARKVYWDSAFGPKVRYFSIIYGCPTKCRILFWWCWGRERCFRNVWTMEAALVQGWLTLSIYAIKSALY